jgi:regulator of protease activity HflC (stomatin/prohibitin superfamily)
VSVGWQAVRPMHLTLSRLVSSRLVSSRLVSSRLVSLLRYQNVFVDLFVSVQYCVEPERVYDAYYKVANPQQQFKAYVYDTVRNALPKITLDEVFESKDEIAGEIKKDLQPVMESVSGRTGARAGVRADTRTHHSLAFCATQFGFRLMMVLVTDAEPPARVKDAMNESELALALALARALSLSLSLSLLAHSIPRAHRTMRLLTHAHHHPQSTLQSACVRRRSTRARPPRSQWWPRPRRRPSAR